MDGAIKYEAYSAITTLNVDDNVLVLIPNGDYGEQKTILNKIVNEDDDIAFNYISPLDSMLRFTKNILDENNLNSKTSILANDNDILIKNLYDFDWTNYSGYDRMGVSFDIQTRLSQYNVVQGSYGLKFSFIGDNGIFERDFGINDMNGNVYHFDTYINQQKLIDISKLQNISRLKIDLYQNNDFIDGENNRVPHTIEGDPILNIKTEKMNDNIMLSNIEIYLGYALGEFDGDTISLSTPGYATYNKIDVDSEKDKGVKQLKVRWIHDNGDGSYVNFTEDDIYQKGLKVLWYRYTLNYTSEEDKKIAGPNWSPYNFLGNSNSFSNSFQPSYEKVEEKIKVMCGILDPATGEYEYESSNILTFTNELAIVDTLTYDAATQLSIVCLDDSEGNYFIYDTSSGIINEGQGQGYIRKFEARYNGVLLDNPEFGLNNITEIEWRLPVDGVRSTMLTYSESYWDSENDIISDNGTVKSIKRKVTEDTLQFVQSYSIKNNWHSSNSFNTVECIVTADGVIYKASLDLQFGKAGTSGSNVTLVLDYEDNENAIIFANNTVRDCYVQATMFNSSGAKITNANGTWNWSLYHSDINQYINIESEGYRAKLTFNKNFDILMPQDNYCILQATFTPGENDIISTPVTAYLPIAFKRDGYSFIEGCRKVIYNSQGVPDYYSDAYSLYDSSQTEITPNKDDPDKITWQLRIDNGENPDIVITWKNAEVSMTGADANTYQWFNFKNLTKNGTYYPALSASPIYVKGYNDRVCLTAKIHDTIVWSQPLLITQSQYDYATVNNWNGTLSIDEGNNTILSAMLGAGRKSDNNTFSGILMGDLGEKDSEESQIGLYGLSNGVVSFSLTESGVATFGKGPNAGQGYMVFGLSDTIDDAVNTITSGNGEMYIDIDYGYANITYNNDIEKLMIGNYDKKNSSYLRLTSSANVPILDFKKDNFLIQSSNFISGVSGLQLDLSNGQLILNNNSKTLKLDSSSSNAITLGNLSVDWNGSLVCNSLAAGSGTNYIGTVASGNYVINLGDFKVQSDGTVYYKETELTTYINNLINAANS